MRLLHVGMTFIDPGRVGPERITGSLALKPEEINIQWPVGLAIDRQERVVGGLTQDIGECGVCLDDAGEPIGDGDGRHEVVATEVENVPVFGQAGPGGGEPLAPVVGQLGIVFQHQDTRHLCPAGGPDDLEVAS